MTPARDARRPRRRVSAPASSPRRSGSPRCSASRPARRRAAAGRGQRVQHRRPRARRASAGRSATGPSCASTRASRGPSSSRARSVPSAARRCCWPCRPSVFEAVAPWLILFTCLLVGVQPWIARWLRSRGGADVGPRTRMGPVTTFFALLTGVYGGYFGAGSGVMMVAVLGLGPRHRPAGRQRASRRSRSSPATSSPALIFVAVADLDWRAIGLLAAGSVVGGYVGARVGRRLPPTALPGARRRRRRRRRGPPAPLTRAGVCRVAGSQGAVASRWRRASSR